jgi:serine protease
MASAGYNVMVLPVRVLGKCGGYDSDIIAGMLWAGGVSNIPHANPVPARVINLSLGGGGTCGPSYVDAVSQLTLAGVVIVAAAGNDEGLVVGVPANCAGVIAVAGVRHAGTKVGYSNIGPEVVVAAPAGNCVNTSGACLYPILTATNTGSTTPASPTYSDSDNYAVGTSFATPLVAGTAALMLAANPSLTPAQVKTLIENSSRPFPTTSTDPTVLQCHAPDGAVQDECICTRSTCGAGLLDTAAAVAAAHALAAPIQAGIAVSSATPQVGTTATLDGAVSVGTPGSYGWSITGGAGTATFTTPTSAAQVGVRMTAAGPVEISLMVTDNRTGASSSSKVVLAATEPPSAAISVSPAAPSAGERLSLDGSGSTADGANGRAISGYLWEVTSGGSIAAFDGSTTDSSARIATSAAGSFTVRLTVTDSAGAQASSTATVAVAAAPSGGGGGAASVFWVLGVLLAAAALRVGARRPGR